MSSKLADFTQKQYSNIKNSMFDEFGNDLDVNTSSQFFALILAQYISDVMYNSPTLPDEYHASLLHMVSDYTKQYIDFSRAQEKLDVVDWNTAV